jgi:hypothetical protein
MGWTPRMTIKQGVIATVQYLQGEQWLMSRRAVK